MKYFYEYRDDFRRFRHWSQNESISEATKTCARNGFKKKLGHIESFLETAKTDPQKQKNMKYEAFFTFNTLHNHMDILELLLKHAPTDQIRHKMIHADYSTLPGYWHKPLEVKGKEEPLPEGPNFPFKIAAITGNIGLMQLILKHCNDDDSCMQKMIHCQNDLPFRRAAGNGFIEVLELLLELTPEQEIRTEMIHAYGDEPFRYAAYRGHKNVLIYLLKLEQAPELQKKMIHDGGEAAFRHAAAAGHIEILNYLLEKVTEPEERYKMVHAMNDDAYVEASSYGFTEITTLLDKLGEEEDLELIPTESLTDRHRSDRINSSLPKENCKMGEKSTLQACIDGATSEGAIVTTVLAANAAYYTAGESDLASFVAATNAIATNCIAGIVDNAHQVKNCDTKDAIGDSVD